MKIVKVNWLDSNSNGGWHDITSAKHIRPSLCITIGYVIDEADDYITIASSLAVINDSVSDVMCIPKFAVSSIETIRRR